MSTRTPEYVSREIFGLVSKVAAKRGVKAFAIGGYVRDCFLGRPSSDIDIVVEGSGTLRLYCTGQGYQRKTDCSGHFL